MISIPASLLLPTQERLDNKLGFATIEEMQNLGDGNYKAFMYYNKMIVMCEENETIYIWKERPEEGQPGSDAEGLLQYDFIYPPGSITEQYNYVGKSFNFFNYMELWLSDNGYCKCQTEPYIGFRFKPGLDALFDVNEEDMFIDEDGILNISNFEKPFNIRYKINVFFTEEEHLLNTSIVVKDENDEVVADLGAEERTLPAYPGEFQGSVFEIPDLELDTDYKFVITTEGDGGEISKFVEIPFKLVE